MVYPRAYRVPLPQNQRSVEAQSAGAHAETGSVRASVSAALPKFTTSEEKCGREKEELETDVRPFVRTRVDGCEGSARTGNVRAAVFSSRTRVECRVLGSEAWPLESRCLRLEMNHGLTANDVHTDLGLLDLRMFWKEWNTTVGKKIDHGSLDGRWWRDWYSKDCRAESWKPKVCV